MWPFDSAIVKERDALRVQLATLEAKDRDSQRIIFAYESRVRELQAGAPNEGLDSDSAWERYAPYLSAQLMREQWGDPNSPNDDKTVPPLWVQRLAFKTAWELKRC